ncbi:MULTISPECIES: phage tail protein [Citrobacter freundii complex]|uniref:phage tail-collar fiber domain-containing protein n=1 Tax=Citrobacter freundii complex TaxID=1344959 RepID=UPI00211E5627|nr:phage tail protein [Citrobacter cronae]MDX7440453.1 phage tail protein [Citrobacter cronae]
MSAKFKTIITTAGAEKLAAATVPGGKKVNITVMAVGDGGGTLPEPNAGQTKLINEVWRHALNKISQDNRNSNYIVAELVIPPEVGGFWMRELGLYDDEGALIAVANMAESYKPELAEGSGRAQTCRMVIIVSSIASVELSIDATTVMATQDYVDDKLAEHEQSRKHPDATLKEKGFVQLSTATDSESESHAATPKAVKAAYDLANGKYTAQDASTAQKGIVQLSSATDSNDEGKAATPKAVKAAYELANGKYTAQDASTTQKGIVQLSSATDSNDEGKAATSKAVKAANDNADKRLAKEQNGRDIPEKDVFVRNIGAARAFSGTVSIGGGGNWTTAEFIVWLESQGAFNHPYWMCKGSWSYGDNRTITDTGCGNIQLAGAVVEVMGVRDAMTIRVTTPTSSTTGVVNAQFTYVNHGGGYPAIWRRDFNTANKPTSEDVGALPITGGALRGPLRFLFQGARPDANCMIANDDASGILSCAYGYYQDRFDIHFYDEKGAWASNPLTISRDGSTSIHGYLAVFGAIDTTEGIYDKGNRVYSPVNPPPATDLSAYATQQWVLQNFVQNIDLTAPAEVGFRDGWGYPRGTDGAAMYNFNMVGGSSNVGNFIIRYMRKQVNNTWYVIN